MSENRWLRMLTRISADAPKDVDAVLGIPAVPDAPTVETRAADHAVSPRLWSRDETRAYIGVRVSTPPTDITGAARRLAFAAIERGVTPVILSALPTTGFERFGFRVERLPSETAARSAAEAELQSFWDMPLIFDLDEVADLS